MKAIIMAGGKGTRFWPQSVESKPKQFLALTSEATMLQETYRRFLCLLPASSIFIVTDRRYAGLLWEQLPEIKQEQVIFEPAQRDTGPCIALTAHHFLSRNDDEVLAVVPSDQYIPDGASLLAALAEAEQVALSGLRIVTLGIKPTRPETGFGYIAAEPFANAAAAEDAPGCGHALKVNRFIEKPPREQAEQLVGQPHVFWNSGIFVWRPSTIAHYMQLHQRAMWEQFAHAPAELFYPQLPKISVDYAILEKADTIFTIPVTFEWDDVGLWTSLERIHGTDGNGNLVQGDAQLVGTHNSIIFTEGRKTAVIGADDLIVVSTAHGLLVCRKSAEQQIKQVLQAWENQGGNHGS